MYIDNMVEETLQNPCNKIAVFEADEVLVHKVQDFVFEADKVLVMKIFWWAKLVTAKQDWLITANL